MRIALAQINPTVGDIAANTAKHLDFIHRAQNQGATLVVFPELSLLGYPPKDLLLKSQFISDSLAALERIARQVSGIDVILGYADRNPAPVGRPLYNAVALLRDGQIHSRHFKTLLPTYDVFDESRYFEPGPINDTENLVRIGDPANGSVIAGMSICEDLWNDEKLIARRLYHQNPIADLNAAGAEILINASASPFVVGKHDFRLQLFGDQVKRFNKPLIYVNQVGGNDELVFDGNSHVLDATGNVIAQAKDFEEDLLVVDLQDASPDRAFASKLAREEALINQIKKHGAERGTGGLIVHPHSNGLESIYKALVLGLKDYVRKCGFKTAVLGLSGGIDSALTAAIAAHALGAENITGVAMPSRYSSDHSIEDARVLAKNLGMHFHLVPIDAMHHAYEKSLTATFDEIVSARAAVNPPPHTPDPRLDPAADLTDQNLQARIRGATLMAFSNRFNHLLLTTGNKSEIAVGYCTLYGDMCGGLAVISDVPKTTVWALSRWINDDFKKEVIPWRSIEKVPSAELKPNQTDQDSLPPYEVLDDILHRYVEEEKGAAEIIADGFDAAIVNRVIKLIDRSEYKRRQAAPGLKVTSRAFGFGRRMPIAQNYVQGV
jgi:NH3-dependent NAD+ synthetase/predicted amidohydrolase